MEKIVRIGVFDSGIGGLSVLAACLRVFPEAEYLYYGDNVHAPYGSRSVGEITTFTARALETFRECSVDAAVLACNTATAVCIDEMRHRFSYPIVGVEPAVKQAAAACRSVLVLATPRTAESIRLKSLIDRFPKTRFEVFPAPRFAAAIEAHFQNGQPLTISDHIPSTDCEGIVLGCTHYSLVRREIAAYYGGKPVFDGGEGTAKRVKSLFKNGIVDHTCSARFPHAYHKNSVKFIGISKEMNEQIFETNKRFQFS